MSSGTRATPAPRESAASLVAWGLVFWTGVLAIGALLARSSTAAVALQAAAADWAAGRLGIVWSEGETPRSAVARRALLGASLGLAAGAIGIAGAVVFHVATLRPEVPVVSSASLGLLVAALTATRDELFVRGLVLRATQRRLPEWAALIACGATTAAVRAAVDPAAPGPIAAEALRGIALGALWLKGGGAWMPCAANAAWTWLTGSLTHGGLLDVAFAGEPTASWPVLVTLVATAAIALAWVARGGTGPARLPANAQAGTRKAGYDGSDAPPSRPGAS
ncbi:MAG TPA: CPBP family glutamic-type intramembrane protease [Polyangiaceae bacterium]|nr:CPBP family glutamic-type intramembrane protease [Polyangiaceae bacterium]